ncbi:TetR/AcrR family transcriptional regulator [Robertmurraya yapensis]|uniref:TetR/AcrR family transcriptional regulator n=1 Tax=Bacillus yapensis TaxID=2492960 RepID=A0A431VVU8_9BACI|nr:TetR/AcrR family transcriptional regulator [Bacillus yapensis]RTR27149.1 TetR/AcrR family transcriptional regulator [Bacillus yapensis]TKS93996.1 TetR family transcriptional regulator [Bacillus yapensis]
MSSFKERKIAKKKEEILRSAAAIFAEKGYHGTTMEEVAAKLLMTKGSMYYYFKNKDALLFHCHQMIMDKSIVTMEEIFNSPLTWTEKLTNAIKAHVQLATSEKSMFMVMDKPNQHFTDEYLQEILASRTKYAQYFDQILLEGIRSKEFQNIDVKMVRMIILGALNWIQEWYSPEGEKSGEEISEAFSAYLLKIVI